MKTPSPAKKTPSPAKNVAVPTSPEVYQDLLRRVTDIDHAYRAIAEKAGQLYMKADEAGLNGITEMLDKPMRNASDNHQAFSRLLADLKLQTPSPQPASPDTPASS